MRSTGRNTPLAAFHIRTSPPPSRIWRPGKHTEVDMFAGTVVRLGKELGVETPVCEMFWHGIHLIEDRIFGNI